MISLSEILIGKTWRKLRTSEPQTELLASVLQCSLVRVQVTGKRATQRSQLLTRLRLMFLLTARTRNPEKEAENVLSLHLLQIRVSAIIVGYKRKMLWGFVVKTWLEEEFSLESPSFGDDKQCSFKNYVLYNLSFNNNGAPQKESVGNLKYLVLASCYKFHLSLNTE